MIFIIKFLIKKVFIGALIVGLVAVGMTEFSRNKVYRDQPKTAFDVSTLAGNYLKENSDILSKVVNSLKEQAINDNDIIADVGNIHLSNSEFQFRKGLKQATSLVSADNNIIFNTLVEEKMLLNYAEENNLLPTQNEVDTFINQEKATYNSDDNYKKIVDSLRSTSGLSLDQYWNTYEFYNSYRAVTFKKVYDFTINNAVKSKAVKALPSGPLNINSNIYKEQLNYYKQFKADLKCKVSVKVRDNYKTQDFSVDTSKNYL